ncbi:MAG: low molecular weight protein arginine phosphatase [Bacillota bacterium]
MKILFVCTGNTCRSSMAVALAAREIERAGLTGVKVLSAGTGAVSGMPASRNAILAMEDMGLDISGHRSTSLDRNMVEDADLILTMSERHRAEVVELCPEAEGKVFTLAGYAGLGGDILDPFGGGPGVYRDTAGLISDMVRLAVDRLSAETGELRKAQENDRH